MFENKLNYITAGMALGLLILLGRFAYMQVVAYDHYAGQAESMRTGLALLPSQRADIRLADGRVIARTESVWDIYLDFEKFADPRTLAQRAHLSPDRYDAQAVQEFIEGKLQPVLQAGLPSPGGRRRFFMFWALRADPVMQADFELCAQRLCLATGVPRADFDAQYALVRDEVDALAAEAGDFAKAPERQTSAAWLRARPALSDNEYWARIVRFPRSVHFEPVLAARLQWFEKEAETLQGLIDAADGDGSRLRELSFSAMRSCRAKADGLGLEVEPGRLNESQAQDILIEEHAAWLRLADACERVVRGDTSAPARRLEKLSGDNGLIATTRERLTRLRRDTLEKYGDDWKHRWADKAVERSPLLLLKEAPREVVELLKVNGDMLPGVTCVRRAARHYEFTHELAHVLGSVGMPDGDRVDELAARDSFGAGLEEMIDNWFDGDHARFRRAFRNELSRQLAGASGIERTYDERLGGVFGARVSGRDAAGRVRGIEYEQPPQNAEPLTLTIDVELQRDILANVKEWEEKLRPVAASRSTMMFNRGQIGYDRWQKYEWTMRGAAVVLDVKTGAILALCSFPDYDPDALAGRSPADRAYQAQLKAEQELETQRGYPWWNQRSRMFNRARDGLYAPGSTFKVITAAALLDSGAITTRDTFTEDRAEIFWNGKLLGRTSHIAYATVNVEEALEVSCNGFFYRWSQELGPGPREAFEQLRHYAELFGIGREVESDLGSSRRGRMPGPERVWAPNLAMLAIGQGEMLSTPLEVARAYAAIATRGNLATPHFSEEALAQAEHIELSTKTWDALHEGMKQVVFGRGTASKSEYAVLRRIRCAGKTGTAENGRGIPDHAWFAGFAPYDDPKVAFVILAANSDLGGAQVSPVIGECIEKYFGRTGVLKKRADSDR